VTLVFGLVSHLVDGRFGCEWSQFRINGGPASRIIGRLLGTEETLAGLAKLLGGRRIITNHELFNP
jgi:hypothetical protein